MSEKLRVHFGEGKGRLFNLPVNDLLLKWQLTVKGYTIHLSCCVLHCILHKLFIVAQVMTGLPQVLLGFFSSSEPGNSFKKRFESTRISSWNSLQVSLLWHVLRTSQFLVNAYLSGYASVTVAADFVLMLSLIRLIGGKLTDMHI